MEKILQHIRKHQRKLTTHIEKHHKKYIFAAGTTIGMCIFKVIVVTTAFLGISLMTGKSNANDDSAKIYQALATFNQIDDIAHQKINEILSKGNPNYMTGEAIFHELDATFHQAKNLNEKFRAARKLDKFLDEQDKLLHQLGDIDPEKDTKFHEINNKFDEISGDRT